jgi:hypothetical protein
MVNLFLNYTIRNNSRFDQTKIGLSLRVQVVVTAFSFAGREEDEEEDDSRGKNIGPTATKIPASTMTPIATRSPTKTASDPMIGGPIKKPQ